MTLSIINELNKAIEDLEWTRDVTQAIGEVNGYHNPDYERYTGYINNIAQELATIEEREDLETEAIIKTMKNT